MPELDPQAYGSADAAVRMRVGDWLLASDLDLGPTRTVDGARGWGAQGWIPVVEWLGDAVGQGIVGAAVASAAAGVVHRLRRRFADGQVDTTDDPPLRFLISRGLAAAVAVDYIAQEFSVFGPLEVEASEQPSAIAGVPVFAVSYTGLEPWVILVVDRKSAKRYYIVVSPQGEILGAMQTDLLYWERFFDDDTGHDGIGLGDPAR